jgi:predicted nucleic acid-binding protein
MLDTDMCIYIIKKKMEQVLKELQNKRKDGLSISIGPYDMLIGAHAKSLGLILVTNNVKEFERIKDLRIENWV